MKNPIDYIPYGHDNPIDRRTLVTLSGLSDRKVRQRIEDAVRAGVIIVNLDNGYFKYRDRSDIPYVDRYYHREMARGWSDINKCRAIRQFLQDHTAADDATDKQLSLFDCGLM